MQRNKSWPLAVILTQPQIRIAIQKQIMDKTKERLTRKEYITIGISIAAIAVSITNFYFQYFRENHSLKISARFDLTDWASSKTGITVSGVLVNDGNRPEILYSGRIKFEHGRANVTLSPLIGPIVLKPGEVTSFEMKDTSINAVSFALDEVGFKSADKDTTYLIPEAEFVTVSPNRDDKRTMYFFDTLSYFEPSDNWSIKGDYKQTGTKWVELLR